MRDSAYYYQILEIEPGASQTEIKQAYKDLTQVWHPDRFSHNPRLRQMAEEKLKQINIAYEHLKTNRTQVDRNNSRSPQQQSTNISLDCEQLRNLLELGKLQDADLETKRILLALAGRERDGWLNKEHLEKISGQSLVTIDNLWTQHSNNRFGFSVQNQIWHKLDCQSSPRLDLQTISENKFGTFVGWRVSSRWLSPRDYFNYNCQNTEGSLPREYIFALRGWWSFSNSWTGYLLWGFDEVFLKL